MEVGGQFHAPAALPQGKSPWYPLGKRLDGPQSRSGHGDEEKNSQPPLRFETRSSDRPACSQSLYRLINCFQPFLNYKVTSSQMGISDLPEGTEKNTKRVSQNNQLPSRESNAGYSEIRA
jgi:hypothetical protein